MDVKEANLSVFLRFSIELEEYCFVNLVCNKERKGDIQIFVGQGEKKVHSGINLIDGETFTISIHLSFRNFESHPFVLPTPFLSDYVLKGPPSTQNSIQFDYQMFWVSMGPVIC